MTDFSPLDSALYESTPEKIAASLRYLRKTDAVMAALMPLSANPPPQPAQVPSYDALVIIAQSVCGALSRAGFEDLDDPGEAIDVLRERYERRIAELEARTAQVPAGVAAALAEVERATRKFPTWPTDPLHAVAVLGEEFGELTKAVLQTVYEPHKVESGELRTEAIQTAAMALRFLASLDAYRFDRSEQHKQGADQ